MKMGRTVYAEEKLLPDLQHIAKLGGYVPGLILGQVILQNILCNFKVKQGICRTRLFYCIC